MALNDADLMGLAAQQIAKLKAENKQLKRRASRLRAKVSPGRWDRILDVAYEDAKIILHLRHAQYPVSRRWLDEAGMVSAWRFGWALGLLRYAGNDILPTSLRGA